MHNFLSKRDYWEDLHKKIFSSGDDYFHPRDSKGKRVIKYLLGKNAFSNVSHYNYFLLKKLFLRCIPQITGKKILEIGSAPGTYLVFMNETFGCLPFGVDYSEVGVEINRRLFLDSRLDPQNIIHADFFSTDFQERFRETFDAVLSFGLLEHFEEPGIVIEKHLNLLKKGGYLIVGIPNLKRINNSFVLSRQKGLLAMHNMGLTGISEYLSCFEKPALDRIFCDYCLAFQFLVPGGINKSVSYFLKYGQFIVNLFLFAFLRGRDISSRHLCPWLLYIGEKKE